MKFKELPFFRHVKWNPDKAELRRFALAMIVGFTVRGALAALRHFGITRTAMILWALGLVLALASLIPGLGRIAYLAIYVPSSFVGFFVSKIVLTVIFFGVFVPIGLLLKLLGKDLLRLRPKPPRAAWGSVTTVKDPNRYYRQF
jgi:hypothetical protein